MLIRFKQQLALIVIFLGLAFASIANASELNTVHNIKIEAIQTISDYYMFSSSKGNDKYHKRITNSLKEISAEFSTLKLSNDTNVNNSYETLALSWNDYKKNLEININDIITRGYPDIRLLDELGKLNMSFNSLLDILYSSIIQNSGTTQNQWVELGRSQNVLIHLITAQYTARSGSNLGQVFTGTVSEQTIDELATQFTAQLKELQNAKNNTPAINKELRSINSKWTFIAKSIKNYNENTVPFIVTKYGERISSSLNNIISLHIEIAKSEKTGN
jgi:hypothetical protein